MAKSTDVAVKEKDELALAAQEQLEAEIAAENQEASDANDIQIPLLKIGQSNTAEVQDGDAAPGSFLNSLTREDLGREIEFVVAGFRKGRFDHGNRDEGKRARKAYGIKTVPWTDDPFHGRPFTEHPDAEEKYSQRVNAGEIEWGKGPRISTTFDFTGYVVSGLAEGEEPIPVCLSLMRMNSKAAKKWVTILDMILRGKYWDAVFSLTTERQTGKGNNFYTISVVKGRKTTTEEKLAALNLAQALRKQAVEFVGEDDSETAEKPEPDAQGGMAV